MTYRFKLIEKSSNRKTGPIPQTYTSSNSCPSSCPLLGYCYAAVGFTMFPWRDTDRNGMDIRTFAKQVRQLPDGQLIRHNIGGDLPGVGDRLSKTHVDTLVGAFKGKRAFSYTHYPVWNHKHAKHNRHIIKKANRSGFTINLSANNLDQADRYMKLGIGPVVTILPQEYPRQSVTKGGNRVVVCPAQTKEGVTCSSCRVCSKPDRDYIVGFLAHGAAKKRTEAIANG